MNDGKFITHQMELQIPHSICAEVSPVQVIYGKIKVDVGRILRQLCDMKQVEIHEARSYSDHLIC